MSAKNTRLLLIAGALVLFVLLFIAPKAPSRVSETGEEGHQPARAAFSTNATLDVYVSTALKNMKPADKQHVDKLAAAKNYDSLIVIFDRLKRPDLASYYTEEKAKQSRSAADWQKAGNRYYYAVQFSDDKTESPVLYQCAMRCLNNSLAIQPNNADAKIMLASCYVEGTPEPMEGIKRLKEVEKTDSNNVKLQLTFAFFSVRSGQMDKAITRFNKVLQVDSNYIEAYLHLADAYERQGNVPETVAMLKRYASKTNDVTARLEVEKYIQQLQQPGSN